MTPEVDTRARRWVLQLHLYGGLIACWYLLIYGITSLNFNHPGLLPEREGPPHRWERAVTIPDEANDLKLAERVRDELGLMGWPLPWAMRRDGAGNLRFEQARPGKKYVIEVDQAAGRVRVEERTTGWRSILGFLHGSTEQVPNAPFTAAWGYYTEVVNWFVLFAVGSGIWLWARRAREKRVALAVLVGSTVLSLAWMGWIYFVG